MAAMALYGKELKFKTPNTVVVFSNEKPDVKELSKDRWKIFRIRDDDLIDVTDIYLEKIKNNCFSSKIDKVSAVDI